MKRIDFTRDKLLTFQKAAQDMLRTKNALTYASTLCALAGIRLTKTGTSYRAKGGGTIISQGNAYRADSQMISLLSTIERLFSQEVAKRTNAVPADMVSVAAAFAAATTGQK